MSERLLILDALAARHGAAAVLLSDPANRRWLGQSEAADETLLLCRGAVRSVGDGDGPGVAETLEELGVDPGAVVAADTARPPTGYLGFDLSDDLAAARMRKDAGEIEAITAAATLASVGQEALRAGAAAGARESELWQVAQAAIAAATADLGPAAAETELLCDLLAGARTAEIDGGPGEARLTPGDPLLFDLAPRYGDYWADSCTTFVVGPASAALRARHDSVRAALDAGIAAARPGAAAGEVDAAVRGRLAADGLSCPHHSGHGVGLSPQEPPFLTPGETTRLEEGMTIAIETGAYGEGFGVRLEHLVLIEADGARRLTTHLLTLN